MAAARPREEEYKYKYHNTYFFTEGAIEIIEGYKP